MGMFAAGWQEESELRTSPMTSRERILCAMQLEKPDRVPVSPFISPAWLSHAEPSMRERLIRETDPLIETGVICEGGPLLGAGASAICRSEPEDGRVVHTIRTPKGELRSVTTFSEKTSCVTEFYLKGPEDVEKLLSIPYEPAPVDASPYHRAVEEYGDEALILIGVGDAVCLPGFWFSPEDFMIACLEDFELVRLLLDTAQSRTLEFLRACKEQGVAAFRSIGAELASQTLMDPSWFPKLVLPYDSELHAEMRRDGGIAYMHCHGRIREILEQVADTGPTALDPIEQPPGGDLSLAEAKRRIGDRVCLVGNLDDLQVIGAASREELLAAGAECIDAAGPAGYVLGGTASGIYTPEMAEGFIVLAEASRRYAQG